MHYHSRPLELLFRFVIELSGQVLIEKERGNLGEGTLSRDMLCLDMKLVSRLRGLSTNSSSGSNSNAASTNSNSTGHFNNDKRRRSSRGSNSNASPTISDRDSDDEGPCVPRIVRDRSRSVCMPVLTSSQMRHLHRRASHHVYVHYLIFWNVDILF